MTKKFEGPTILTGSHNTSKFDCEVDALNTFVKQYALQNQKNDSARTFVATLAETTQVVGFYSLCAASMGFDRTPDRVHKGLARHDVPLVLLARLAVDKNFKGQGLGISLLLDAFGRFIRAQETIGARALLAHAKDDSAKAFYERWGFIFHEELPFHLYILTKDIRATLAASK